MCALLGAIAESVNGELVGEYDKVITGIELLHQAKPDQIALVTRNKTLRKLESGSIAIPGALIVSLDYDGSLTNIIKVKNTQLACAKIISIFHPEKAVEPAISSQADVSSSTILGKDVFIGPFASIGARATIGDRVVIQSGVHIEDDVTIGDDTILSYNTVVFSKTQIGQRVVVQTGSLIGSDGFGYVNNEGELCKIPHVGCVVIEDDVHLGAYNTIERGNLGQTLIQKGVKTGNLVHIGHNVIVGRNTRIIAQAGIASNTVIGSYVTIGPQAGIDQRLTIGHFATIGPKAGIMTDIADGESGYGIPGIMSRLSLLRSASVVPKLPEMQKEIKRMTQEINELKTRLGDLH